MGHPHSYGWRAGLRAERRRQVKRVVLTAGALFAFGALIADCVGRYWGAW